MPDIVIMLKNCRTLGLGGIAIVDQGGKTTPFMAACLTRGGDVCDPRNFDTHATPDAALTDLARKLEGLIEHKARKDPAAT